MNITISVNDELYAILVQAFPNPKDLEQAIVNYIVTGVIDSGLTHRESEVDNLETPVV